MGKRSGGDRILHDLRTELNVVRRPVFMTENPYIMLV